MTDEIKRAAEDILNRSLPFAWTMYEKYGIETLEKEFSNTLLAHGKTERRKAYEECIRIAKEMPIDVKRCCKLSLPEQAWAEGQFSVANEIRRRMEGVC